MPWFSDEYRIPSIDDNNYINYHLNTYRFFHDVYTKSIKDLSKNPEMEVYNLYETFIKLKYDRISSFGIHREYTMEELIAFTGAEAPFFTGINNNNKYVIAIDRTLVEIYKSIKNICASTNKRSWLSAYNRFIWQISSTCNKYYMTAVWDESTSKTKIHNSKSAKWHFTWYFNNIIFNKIDRFNSFASRIPLRFSSIVFDRIPTIRNNYNILVSSPVSLREFIITSWWEFVFNYLKKE